MARRTANLTIRAQPTIRDGKIIEAAKPGRDEGKLFVLTEMSAARADDWAQRAFLALANAGADVPDDIRGAGVAGITLMSLQALSGLRHADAKPLLDEMLTCAQICPNPAQPNVVRVLNEDDIEEVLTFWELRKAILEVHIGFSVAGSPLRSGQSATAPLATGVLTRTSPGL